MQFLGNKCFPPECFQAQLKAEAPGTEEAGEEDLEKAVSINSLSPGAREPAPGQGLLRASPRASFYSCCVLSAHLAPAPFPRQ